MNFFGKLVAKLTGGKPQSAAQAPSAALTPPQNTGGIRITITNSSSPSVEVSDAEIEERVSAYSFVLTTDAPVLKTANEWWNEDTHKRRRREGSEKAYAWVLPFLPINLAKLHQLQAAQEWGPHGANAIAKELRALIRERRKLKEQFNDLLKGLYGACVASDLAESLAFEGTSPRYMARFVDINELQNVKLDYNTMGYQCLESLSKTDVKWLVEAFGEPSEHQSFDALWPSIRRNAIARYCWHELRSKNDANKSLGLDEQSMQKWLYELVKRNIGYHKEWQDSVAARRASLVELTTVLEAAWAATSQPFVVADLETTGLNTATDEVLELAAARVSPDGAVVREFSALVRVARVPAEITRLTGITQELVDREGLPLPLAMKAFAEFVGAHPLFFHNAPFDQGFLKKACVQTKVKLNNPVHDTLPLARQAWPALGTYKLGALAARIGATVPTHRGLSDVKATLAVLLAARQTVGSKS